MSVFVIPVFYHGGKLVRTNGKLHYLDGKVEKFPPMDINFVNKKDLEELFKGLGYLTYREIYWHDPTVIEFEDGLHVLYGDKEINNMCDFTMRNNLKEFHLYFEHGVDIPEVTEDEPVEEEWVSEDEDVLAVTDSSKSSSSSYDSYESAEDEVYKPPPPGYETDSSEEAVEVESKKKKIGKSCSPNTMSKRRASRRYTGKRRMKHVLNTERELGEIRAKLKKQKKKVPKRPHAPPEEIPISQSAPPVESQGEAAQPSPTQTIFAQPAQPSPAPPAQKGPAPTAQPTPAPPSQPNPVPPAQPSARLWPKLKTFKPPAPLSPQTSHQPVSATENIEAITKETVAASSGGASSDILKFIPTPNFRPPKQT